MSLSSVYMCLPVWREWKLDALHPGAGVPINIVYMCLPVWREWKHTTELASSSKSALVYMCLPVWREWKPRFRQWSSWFQIFVYMCLPVWREWKREPLASLTITLLIRCLHVPSRLEGMETTPPSTAIPYFGFGVSTCAFPFGGNGNYRSFVGHFAFLYVYMCLPVWREWKREPLWILPTA